MSKTIDQRVVEMQFDNRQFESGVKTSMSTIDKLKQKLNFTDAGKGLENIGAAAKKIDMNSLAKGVEAVQVKFSSLQVIATTALANITNAAVNAGKNLVSSFTVDPIVQGFQEYETQMNAIQTILANTQSKGTTLDEVKDALAELNTYADQTIYNFTEMTRNIGTFTAAGVGLKESTAAIKGIANLAAVSGSNSQQAATAMYQLSQALAAGRVSLMDWNSVVNAGMGGELFQNALIRTAQVMGTGVDQAIEKYGTFRESLTKGQWLTAEVLTETLSQLSGAYTEADLIAQGYSEQQAKEIVELANTAVDAATKVKTFTQLIDTMKEAVGSGWAQTWQLIIGDFEEAKELWTGISDFFTGDNGIITKMSAARNTILEGALYGNPFSDLAKRIDSVTTSTDKMTSSTKDYSSVVDKVIRGDFGNGAERVEKLTKANYDYAHAQNLVNEKLGSSVRHATDYKEAQDGVSESTKTTAEDLVKFSDAQLVMMGFTEKEVEALRDLEEQSQRTGIPLNKLIENVDQLNGRTLLINSFKNAAKGLVQVFTSISDGWRKAFWGDASEDDILAQKTERLYNLIAALHKFSQNLVMSEDTVNNLTRTFEGLFAILDLVTTILGGGFKLAFEVLSKLLGAFDMDILDLTARLGDAAVALRDFILDNEFVNKGFDAIASGIVTVVQAVKSWITAFLDLPMAQSAIEKVKATLSNLKEVGLDAIEGLKEGLQNGITSIPEILMEIGRKILDAIKSVLGINSPSTEMRAVGEFTIQGFIEGIHSGAKNLYEAVKDVFSKVIDVVKDIFSGITFGDIIAAAVSVGLIVFANRVLNILDAVVAPLEGFGDVLSGLGNVLDEAAKPIAKTINGVAKVLSGFALQLKAKALVDVAKAIAILAGSLTVLAFIPAENLIKAVAAIGALAVVLGGLTAAVGKFGPKSSVQMGGMAVAFIGIGAALLLMANSLKSLSGLNPENLLQTISVFGVLIASMMGLLAAIGKIANSGDLKDASKLGTAMLKLSASLLIMSQVIKILGEMELSAVVQGGVVITALMGVMTLLGVVGGVAGKNANSLGSAMLKLSVSLYLMIGVVKLLSMMDPEDIAVGTLGLTAFVGVISLLSLATRLAGKNSSKLGTSLLAMSASLLILTGVVALLAKMDVNDIQKGITALTAFTGVIGVMLLINRLAGSEAPKMATTILSMSLAVGALAGVAVLLSLIDIEGLKRGITAVGFLSLFMTAMIAATKNVNSVTGNLVAMTVAIGLMAAAVAGLSFIEPEKLLTATASMTILMGMFALVEKAGSNIQKSMGSLIVMTTAVGLLGGILIAMGLLPMEGTLEKATALGVLMASLSASMLMISKTGKVNVANTAILAGLAAVLGIISASILGVLAAMNVEPSIETAAALSILLISLSAVTIALGVAGAAASGAAAGAIALVEVVGILGVLLLALGALNSIPGLQEFVEKGIPLLNAIASGLGQAIGNLISGLGVGLTAGLPAIADNLSAFMASLQPFIEGAKAIDSTVLDSVGTLAGIIIALTAADIIQGIASFLGIGGDLTSFADQLIPFGDAMAKFGETINGKLDPTSINAAATAGNMLAELNKSLPRSGGFLQDFLGSQDLGLFGDQLGQFGEAIVAFSQAVTGKIDQSSIEAAAAGGQALAELNKSLPRQGGALQEFLGSQDLGLFGTQLKQFGEAIVSFSQTVTGNVDQAGVEAAAAAGQTLAELNSNLPKQDGWMQTIFGEQDLALFGSQLKRFGEAIVSFSETVAGKVDQEAVNAAAAAGETLATLNEKLPKQDGWLQTIFGEQDLSLFGTQLESFGNALVAYSSSMAEVDTANIEKTTPIVDELVYMSRALGTDKWFSGTITFDEFGSQLQKFGNSFSNFYSSISGIDANILSGVVTQISRLIGLSSSMVGLDTSGMSNFGKGLKDLAKADIDGVVMTYTNAYSRIETAVQGLVTAMSTSVSNSSSQFVSSVSNMITDSLTEIRGKNSEFTTAGQELVTNLVSGIDGKQNDPVKAFEAILKSVLDLISQNGSDFNNAGQGLVKELVSGIDSQSKTASNSFTNVLSTMVTSIRNEYANFYNAGGYLVQGFANGISASTYMATAKAQAMAQAAETAAKNALGVHSPSTVFEEIGENTVEGYEKGIAKKMPAVADSGEELGDSMIEATKHALDITSDSSELAEKVIGESFVNGIAEGIEKDDTAEEAAEKKAQNIVTAFSNALEKIDLSSSTNDLKSQIWDALSENLVSEGQSEAAKLDSLLKEYEYQTQRLELAKAEYQTMVDQFGESSDNAKESYNKYLQEQLDLVNTFNEIVELKKSVSEREGDVLDRQEEQLEREYDLWSEKALGDEEELNRAQKALLDLAKLTERYEIQVKRVESAKAYYDSLSQAFGKDSKNALEAYDAYLDEYSEQTELSTELYQAQVDQMQWGVTSYGKYLDALKEQKKKNLLSEGLSEEEAGKKLDSLFRNFNKSTESIAAFVDEFREIVTGSFATVANDTTTAYMDSVDETFGSMTEDFKQYGESYAEALNEGFKEGMSSSDSDKATVSVGSAEIDSSSKSDLFSQMQDMFSPITGESSTLNQDISSVFNNLGKNAMSEFVSGMQSELSDVNSLSSSVSSMIEQIGKEMQSALTEGGTITSGEIDPDSAPAMAQPIVTFFQALAESLRVLYQETYMEVWLAVGMAILMYIQQGMEEQKPIFEAWLEAFCQFFYDVIELHQPVFFAAGEYVVTEFASGISAGASKAVLVAQSVGGAIAGALVGGFYGGMQAGMDQIAGAVQAVTDTAIGQMQSALQINSPSKVTMSFGSSFSEGFAKGITNGEDMTSTAALSMVQNTISRIAEAVDGGMDVEPTIRPVLDLSNVEEGTRRISAMFSRNQALSIDRSMSGGRSTIDSADQNGDTTSESGNTFNFTQNNYSPKSLSRVEIYRQTKNQFSTFQRMVRV